MSAKYEAFANKCYGKMLHLHLRGSPGLALGIRAVVINHAAELLLVWHRYASGGHVRGGGV